MRWRSVLLALSLAVVVHDAAASDELDLDTSTVTGNRELPKVMVIVPWKKAAPGDIPGRPVESLLDEAVSPVEREVFRVRLSYYRELQQESAGSVDEAEEE